MTPAREAQALHFAHRNHPQLAKLLSQLETNNKTGYKRALRDLFQASERLARIKERSPERYELSLRAWKLDSRIRLLLARMTMSDDVALESELKAALLERVDIRVQELRVQRQTFSKQYERVSKQLERIDKTMQDIERDRDAAAQKDLNRLKRGLGGTARRRTKRTSKGSSQEKNVPSKSKTNRRESSKTGSG